ncbi:hypothetical protein MVEN_02308800 [Mycena venus]|uniref:Polyprotein n=1 Tax=Mycena venus TaxID=2733690 RepID=A0A8H6X4E8_9AGAR|nr:hypothetical protein MVEN_02308800 [Mycena venus]
MTETNNGYRITPLEGTQGYPAWSTQMMDILHHFDYEEYVDGSLRKRPEVKDQADATEVAAAAKWDKQQRKALTHIRLRVGVGPLAYISWATTAVEAWDKLKSVYQPKGAINIIRLRRQLFRMTCEEGENVEEHIRKVTDVKSALEGYGSTISEEESQYSPRCRTLGTIGSSQANRPGAKADADDTAFAVRNTSNSGNKTREGGCFHCGRPGHRISDCRDKTSGKTYTDQQKQQNFDRYSHNKRAKRGKGYGSSKAHVAEESSDTTDIVFAAGTRRGLTKNSWLLDSAASTHIANKTIFSTFFPLSNHEVIGIGSKRAEGNGTVTLQFTTGSRTNNVTLQRVLYLPSSPHNLISLGKLHRAGHRVTFPSNSLDAVITTACGITLAHCKNIGNVYALGNVKPSMPGQAATTSLAFSAVPKHTLNAWHRIFGHVSSAAIKELAEKDMVSGMRIIPDSMDAEQCTTCIAAKQHVESFPKQASRTYTDIDEMTFTDVWGPARTKGIRGERYFITFTDGAKRFKRLALMKAKSDVDAEIENYKAFVETQTGKRCKVFHFDGGGEYASDALRKRLRSQRINIEITAAHSPQQNGVAERLNRTILERARAMLDAYKLPEYLWPEAVTYATYLINRSPTVALKGNQTPYEAFWGVRPNVAKLQEFGAVCWVLNQGKVESKFAPKSKPYRFVGISEDSTAWRCLAAKTRKVLTSRNVVFQTASGEYETVPAVPYDSMRLEGESQGGSELDSSQKLVAEKPAGLTNPQTENQSKTIQTEPEFSPEPNKSTAAVDFLHQSDIPSCATSFPCRLARPYWRDVRNNPKPNDMANVAVDIEPTTYRQAIAHPCADDWLKVMKEELTQLEELGTFSLMPLPEGRKPLGNKWVYRNKLDEMGNIAQRKAYLVVLGNSEIPGTDYNPDQISSPIVRAETNRLLLALAARYDLEMHTVDVKGAYLNGELREEIYMKQPEGFSDGTPRVWRLHKTIYGLEQSGRVWNETLDAHFKKHKSQRLLTDRCVYVRRDGKDMTIVAVHVDDMSIYASNVKLISCTEDKLESSFQITRLGDAKQLLGMEIHRDRAHGTLTITQSTYINKILAFHGMDSSNVIATPMDPNVKLTKLQDGESHPDIKNVYQSMVGALMYAAITTRPDIAYAVQMLSQFSSNHGPVHLTAVKRVYRYLHGTVNLGITYSASPDSNVVMHADFSEPRLYSDADWGNVVDDRKSISGFVTTLTGGAVTWSSKKQPTVALSTMEAEYIALSHAVRENLWLRQLFSELDCSATSPTPVFVDNRRTIDFTFNAGFHARSKHINIRHHFIRDAVASNKVSLHHCTSEENVADIFTKPLARPQHENQVHKLGMTRV